MLTVFADDITSCCSASLWPVGLALGWLGMSVEDYDGLARAEDYFQECPRKAPVPKTTTSI
jgi:hypothetical protein